MTEQTDQAARIPAPQPEPDHRPAEHRQLEQQLCAIAATAVAEEPALRISFELAVPAGPDGARRRIAALEPNSPHYAASTMKLPLVLAAHRLRDAGTLDLDSTVKVHNRFTSRTGEPFGLDREDDSDEQVWNALGSEVSLRWLCRRAIVVSSNLATNLLLEAVGFEAVGAAIDACGADGVEVVRMIGDFAAQRYGHSNLVTASGLNAILLALAAGSAAAPETCDEVLDILADNEVATDVRPGLPAGTWVAHKNGWVSDAVLDAALVRPAGRDDPAGQFALTVAISGRWPNENAHAVIQRMAATVWQHRSVCDG